MKPVHFMGPICVVAGGYLKLTPELLRELAHAFRDQAMLQTGSAMNTGIFLDVLA